MSLPSWCRTSCAVRVCWLQTLSVYLSGFHIGTLELCPVPSYLNNLYVLKFLLHSFCMLTVVHSMLYLNSIPGECSLAVVAHANWCHLTRSCVSQRTFYLPFFFFFFFGLNSLPKALWGRSFICCLVFAYHLTKKIQTHEQKAQVFLWYRCEMLKCLFCLIWRDFLESSLQKPKHTGTLCMLRDMNWLKLDDDHGLFLDISFYLVTLLSS